MCYRGTPADCDHRSRCITHGYNPRSSGCVSGCISCAVGKSIVTGSTNGHRSGGCHRHSSVHGVCSSGAGIRIGRPTLMSNRSISTQSNDRSRHICHCYRPARRAGVSSRISCGICQCVSTRCSNGHRSGGCHRHGTVHSVCSGGAIIGVCCAAYMRYRCTTNK